MCINCTRYLIDILRANLIRLVIICVSANVIFQAFPIKGIILHQFHLVCNVCQVTGAPCFYIPSNFFLSSGVITNVRHGVELNEDWSGRLLVCLSQMLIIAKLNQFLRIIYTVAARVATSETGYAQLSLIGYLRSQTPL